MSSTEKPTVSRRFVAGFMLTLLGTTACEAGYLRLKGGRPAGVAPTLQALGLTSSSATSGSAGSTIITGTTAGSTVTLTDTVGGIFSVSYSAPNWSLNWTSAITAGTFSPAYSEALAGATNTPHAGSFLVTAAAPGGMLAPSAQWNGTLGSGFGGANPALASLVPATRTRSRPTCRPLFLEHHMVTGVDGTDWVVFSARSKYGISKVRAWLEGNFVDITTRRWVTYTDIRGTARKLYGYAVQLDYAAAQAAHANGQANILAQSFSKSGLQQTQATIPFTVHFRPGAALTAGSRYDVVKTVGSGGDYATLGQAMSYAASVNTTTYVGIKIITSGNWRPEVATTSLAYSYRPIEIFAASGVSAVMGDYTTANTYTQLDGVRFRGLGIKIDTSVSTTLTWAFWLDTSSRMIMQFEGVEIYTGNGNGVATISGSGAGATVGGNQTAQFWIGNASATATNRVAYKDCYAHDITSYGLSFGEAVINCDQSTVSGSGCENINGVVHGGSMTNIGGTCSGFMSGSTNLTVHYSGGGTPTIQKLTVNGQFGNLLLQVNGTTVASVNIDGVAIKTVNDIVNAINAVGGAWSATLNATSPLGAWWIAYAPYAPSHGIGIPVEGDPPAPFTAGNCALTIRQDIHADTFVHHSHSSDNLIVEFIEVAQCITTSLFAFYDTSYSDVTYGNVTCTDASLGSGYTSQGSAMAGDMSHFWLEDITVIGGTETSIPQNNAIFDGTYDADCGVYNMYWPGLSWLGGYPLTFDGFVVRGDAPTGLTTNCKSVLMAAESTFLNTTTLVPVTGGALQIAGSRYAGAKVASGDIDNSTFGNYGWQLAA